MSLDLTTKESDLSVSGHPIAKAKYGYIIQVSYNLYRCGGCDDIIMAARDFAEPGYEPRLVKMWTNTTTDIVPIIRHIAMEHSAVMYRGYNELIYTSEIRRIVREIDGVVGIGPGLGGHESNPMVAYVIITGALLTIAWVAFRASV